MSTDDRIRAVLDGHARLMSPVDGLPDEADLYRSGLTSHASVNVMLALEDEFDIEFPERLLRKGTFESIRAIREAVSELVASDHLGATP